MPLPTLAKNWAAGFDTNNRIVAGGTLVQVMRDLLFEVKEWLKSKGLTVAGSSDGTSANMSGTDLWDTALKAGTRGANATSPQSWIVLNMSNGTQVLFAYQSGSDDILRLSISPAGSPVFALAGTPTHQPTAADEVVSNNTTSWINSVAAGDRIWSGMIDSTGDLWRVIIFKSGQSITAFGVEKTNVNRVDTGSVVFDGMVVHATLQPTIGSFLSQTSFYNFSSSNAHRRGRITVASVPFNVDIHMGVEQYNNSLSQFTNTLTELQGQLGYPMFPLLLGTATTSARGPIGAWYDQWQGRTSAGEGDTYGSNEFISLFTSCGLVWPWNGSTPVVS